MSRVRADYVARASHALRGWRATGASGARTGSSGSVTAELALTLPAVVLVLSALLGAGEVIGAQLRCADAARAGARLAARGEPADVIGAAGRRLAPDGSQVRVATGGPFVSVAVSAQVRLAFGVVDVPVAASATADREQP